MFTLFGFNRFWFFILLSFFAVQNILAQSDVLNWQKEGKQLILLADSCKEIYDYDYSVELILKAYKIYSTHNDVDGLVYSKLKMAEINRHARMEGEALNHLRQAEGLIRKNPSRINDSVFAYYYNRKAAILSEFLSDNDSAFYYSLKALDLAQKHNNLGLEFASIMEMGLVYENRKNYKKALEYYKKANQIAKIKKSEQSYALLSIARIYRQTNRYQKSLQAIDEAILHIDNPYDYYLLLRLYNLKYMVHEALGDYDKAFNSLKIRTDLTSKYYRKLSEDKLMVLQKEFKLKEKNNQLKQKEALIARSRKNQILLSSVIALIGLVILILVYYLRRLKKSKEQIKNVSEENAFLLKEANHRINNNLQLIIALFTQEMDKSHLDSKEKVALKKILSKIESIAILHRHLYKEKNKTNVNLNNYLKEIECNFHPLFSEQLIVSNITCDTLKMNADFVMYLGLMLTELYVNTLKHSFGEQEQKSIWVRVYKTHEVLTFEYSDNGFRAKNKKIQPKIIGLLCTQIKVESTLNTENGFSFQFKKRIA